MSSFSSVIQLGLLILNGLKKYNFRLEHLTHGQFLFQQGDDTFL